MKKLLLVLTIFFIPLITFAEVGFQGANFENVDFNERFCGQTLNDGFTYYTARVITGPYHIDTVFLFPNKDRTQWSLGYNFDRTIWYYATSTPEKYPSNINWYTTSGSTLSSGYFLAVDCPHASTTAEVVTQAKAQFFSAFGISLDSPVNYMKGLLVLILAVGLGILRELLPLIIALVIIPGIVYFFYRGYKFFKH